MSNKDKNPPQTQKKVVYGRDGRRMHENSLKNIADKSNGFQKYPENRITDGGKRPDKVFRKQFMEVLDQPVSKKDKRTKLMAICEKIVTSIIDTESEAHVRSLSELLIGTIDGKISDSVRNPNAITVEQGVIILPEQKIHAQITDHEEVNEE